MPPHAGTLRAARARAVSRTGAGPLVRVWLAWLVLMAGVNLATPLYAVYADRFGFSSLVLTAIFAVYAVVLLPSLLLFGGLSDLVGRRPLLLVGLGSACAGLGLFAAARGTAWLFGARVLQGLAVGAVSGPATAALVELERGDDERRPALLAGLAQAGGSAAGPLLCGVLAAWGPAPRMLPYLVVLALTVVAIGATATVPEPASRSGGSWRVPWPRVPAEIRSAFARVGLTAATVWATVALCLSIVPSYAGDLLESRDLALFGATAAAALAASSVAQLATYRLRLSVRRAQAVGLAVLTAGLVGLVAAAPLHSLPVLLAGTLSAGAGHGLGFLGAQQELNDLAPAERRGEVTSAFICCIYLLVACAVLASGALDEVVSLQLAVSAVAVALAAVAAATCVWQLCLDRPRRPRHCL